MQMLRCHRRGGTFFVILCALWLCACGKKKDLLETFRLDDRFRMELFASEPLLDGPIAMAFDDEGRVFVLESPVFPLQESSQGHIKLLEDSNGDGRPDRAGPVPTGVQIPARFVNWQAECDRTSDTAGNSFSTGLEKHVQHLAAGSVPRSISDHGERAFIYPITEDPVYPVLTEANQSTSTTGITFYSNGAVAGFERALFTAEPVHNLVHCDLLTASGPGFVARRAREEVEFLASTDPLFRPVSFCVGAKSALYVVDYSGTLAGPTEVLEVGVKPFVPLFQHTGKGRIYRIIPRAGTSDPRPLASDPGPHNPDRGPRTPDISLPASVPLPARREQLERIVSDPRERDLTQAAAVRALSNLPGDAAAVFLLSKWRNLTTSPRAEAMEGIFREPSRLLLLLDSLEHELIPLWCLDAEHRVRLLRNGRHGLAERTRKLLEAHDPTKNPAVMNYEEALTMRGDKEAGELVYRRLCGRCHSFHGGNNYGPDLWTVSSRPRRQILIDILLPSDSMAPGREMYLIDLRSGGSVDGIIGSQDASTIKVLHDESRQETVLREDIQRILLSDSSAMPVDLASQISVKDMADLLRFLTSR